VHSRSRWTVWLWIVSVVLALGLGFVFGRWAFGTPQVGDTADASATVQVSTMTVGRSVPVIVSASWSSHPFGVGAAEGVLTSLNLADGGTANVGDVLYTVDLRPVVAAVGPVPAFRDVGQGDSGTDVAQLQQFLSTVGLFSGTADGQFGTATASAVKAWQKSLGVATDGVVRAGDIVYTAQLPVRVRLEDGMAVGTRLSPGDVVLSALDPDPEFDATILAGSSVSPSQPIEVVFGDETVETAVTSTRPDQAGNSIWVLTREDGSPVCGDQCDQVPLDPTLAVYSAEQVVTPAATGPGVPAAAVWFTAGGDPYLVTVDGTQIPVTIASEGQGSVVLDGVNVGTVVILAGESSGASQAPPASTAPQPTGTPS